MMPIYVLLELSRLPDRPLPVVCGAHGTYATEREAEEEYAAGLSKVAPDCQVVVVEVPEWAVGTKDEGKD